MCVTIATVLVITSFVSLSLAKPAYAAPAQPPTDWSFYMTTASANQVGTLGCNQGKFDGSHHTSSMVVLDFGAQYSDGSGTEGYKGATFSNAQIESLSETFADEYYICTGLSYSVKLNLAISTNDSPPAFGSTGYNPSVYTSLGQTWATVVSAAIQYDKNNGAANQVYIWGGNDIESWCNNSSGSNLCTPASDATAWVQGYSASNPAPFDNFGSADNCPTNVYSNATCYAPKGYLSTYNYQQSNYYYYSWGALPSQVTPEIYQSAWGQQWAMISRYGAYSGQGTINFQAPLDEHDLYTTTDTSAQAWNDLWNALNAAAVPSGMNFSCEIHYES